MSSNLNESDYIDALDLPINRNPETDLEIVKYEVAIGKALDRAHQLRRFEIENYWRRATYFWAFQLAAFTLFGLILKETIEPNKLIRSALLIPVGLGVISAFVGWLTAKGSKFWQQNWEAHVDALEKNVEGRLTQVVFYQKNTPYSVSRLNQAFMALLFWGWFSAFIVVCFEELEEVISPYVSIVAIILLISSLIYLAIQVSSLNGHLVVKDSNVRKVIKPYQRAEFLKFLYTPWFKVKFFKMRNTNKEALALADEDAIIIRKTALKATQPNQKVTDGD